MTIRNSLSLPRLGIKETVRYADRNRYVQTRNTIPNSALWTSRDDDFTRHLTNTSNQIQTEKTLRRKTCITLLFIKPKYTHTSVGKSWPTASHEFTHTQNIHCPENGKCRDSHTCSRVEQQLYTGIHKKRGAELCISFVRLAKTRCRTSTDRQDLHSPYYVFYIL